MAVSPLTTGAITSKPLHVMRILSVLCAAWSVDEVLMSEGSRIVGIRFGHVSATQFGAPIFLCAYARAYAQDWDPICKAMDEQINRVAVRHCRQHLPGGWPISTTSTTMRVPLAAMRDRYCGVLHGRQLGGARFLKAVRAHRFSLASCAAHPMRIMRAIPCSGAVPCSVCQRRARVREGCSCRYELHDPMTLTVPQRKLNPAGPGVLGNNLLFCADLEPSRTGF